MQMGGGGPFLEDDMPFAAQAAPTAEVDLSDLRVGRHGPGWLRWRTPATVVFGVGMFVGAFAAYESAPGRDDDNAAVADIETERPPVTTRLVSGDLTRGTGGDTTVSTAPTGATSSTTVTADEPSGDGAVSDGSLPAVDPGADGATTVPVATSATAAPSSSAPAPSSDTTARPPATTAQTPATTARPPVTTARPPSPSTTRPAPTTTAGRPLQLANPGSQTTRLGSIAWLTLSVDGGTGSGLSFSASGLPAGLGINSSTGVISGWAFQETTASVTATVTDSSGTSHSQGFTWVVERRRR